MQLWASGAPLRAAPKPRGRRLPPIPSAAQGCFALRACWGSQPLTRGTSATSQVQPMSCSEQ
eukprot:7345207-Alexandrium_andersonii.AAC.1